MSPTILYRIKWIETATNKYVDELADDLPMEGVTQPEGWAEHCIEMGWEPDAEFFLPSINKTYRTREAAVNRAALVNRWGGNVEVIATIAEWMPLGEYDAEMEKRAARHRLAEARTEVAELEELLGMRSPY